MGDDIVEAPDHLEELQVPPPTQEVLPVIHSSKDHLGRWPIKIRTGWKQKKNLDDAQVVQDLHARHPPPARSLKHSIRSIL